MTALRCRERRRPLKDPGSREREHGPDCWRAKHPTSSPPPVVRRVRRSSTTPITGQTELPLEAQETPMYDPAERRPPEEWCEQYGLTVLDPDGWRTPGAPAWSDPVGLAEFYHRAIESTVKDVTSGGGFARIKADLDAWTAAEHA